VKSTLRLVAAILFLATIGFWAATGANHGWTKTSVPQKVADPVTGIEGVTYEKKFVPGVDFLAVITAASLALAGASFFFRTKSGQTHQTNKPTNQ
jgi:hypothetical protein